jgi:isopenicillin N synthase-like dioxygenase
VAQPAALPVLDISRFHGRDHAEFLAELRTAAHEVGFFYITGHGVPASLQDDMLRTGRSFFALPQEELLEIENIKSPHFRGYSPPGSEYSAGKADWRELIHIGPERSPVDTGPDTPAYFRLIGPNQWPSALPELRETVLRWQKEALRVSLEVLRALAAALGQRETHFEKWFDDEAAAHVEIVHYPPRPTEDTHQGVGAHTDYGYLALLQQDEVGGLQVRRGDGRWIDAAPMPHTFIVNFGEMMEVATGGYLKATPHRVISPQPGVDRYSVPFFLGPRLDAVVEPMILPAELRRQGPIADSDAPLPTPFGETALDRWMRAHPHVAERWWADVQKRQATQ